MHLCPSLEAAFYIKRAAVRCLRLRLLGLLDLLDLVPVWAARSRIVAAAGGRVRRRIGRRRISILHLLYALVRTVAKWAVLAVAALASPHGLLGLSLGDLYLKRSKGRAVCRIIGLQECVYIEGKEKDD